MKRLLFALLLCFLAIVAYPQQYKVYSVIGNVMNDGKAVTAKQNLAANSVIMIQKGAKIVLFDSENNNLATLKTEGQGTISNLLKIEGNTSKKVSGSYLSFITQKMASEDSKDNTYMQSAGTAYRDTDDLLNDSIPTDSIRQPRY